MSPEEIDLFKRNIEITENLRRDLSDLKSYLKGLGILNDTKEIIRNARINARSLRTAEEQRKIDKQAIARKRRKAALKPGV